MIKKEIAIDVSPKGYSESDSLNIINVTEVNDVIVEQEEESPGTALGSDESSSSDSGRRSESVVGITRLFECTEDYYNSKKLLPDEFFEYTLYLVNHGASLDDNTKQNTDLYFGSRKMTDFLVVEDYPGNTEYPNDKIYLVPYYQEDVVVGYNVYFKSNNIVVPLQTSSISSIDYDSENGYVQVVFKTTEGELVFANLLVVDSEGSLPSSTIGQIVDQVSDSIAEEVSLKWSII